MSRLGSSIAAVVLAALACAPAAWAAQEQPAPGGAPATRGPVFSATELIVQWAGGAGHGEKVEARDGAEVDFSQDLGNRKFQLVGVEPGQSVRDALRTLKANSAVAIVERNSFSTPDALPNDPLFGEQWGLQNLGMGIQGFEGGISGDDINVVGAWDRTTGAPSVVVADIDTGYRLEHPDLASVVWTNQGEKPNNGVDDDGNGIVDDFNGADFVGSDSEVEPPPIDGDPTDDDLISGGHGVHTAGIIGATGNNYIGISGVAHGVQIMPLRVCSRAPLKQEVLCPISSQIAAINYAARNGARVANMSLSGNGRSPAELKAIAEHPNLLVVIAAGNDAGNNDSEEDPPRGPHYPCDYRPDIEPSPAVPGAIDNILCVAATNQADELASFSDWGSSSVDLGAPGTEILSTYSNTVPFADSFENEDFAARWNPSNAGFGRAQAGDGPLTSHGMTDSPGAPPNPGAVYEVLSEEIALPPETDRCKIQGLRYRKGGSLTYGMQVSGGGQSSFIGGESSGATMKPFNTAIVSGLEGHSVRLFFRYTASADPGIDDGVWLDNIRLSCIAPLGAADGYEFLQGTSMAAPEVSGAAALLLSFEPATRVPELRHALLAGTDPIASLAGKTVSGGRLDVNGALDVLEAAPAAPTLTATDPASPANDNQPLIAGSAEAGTEIDLYANASCGGPVAASGTVAELESPGIAVAVADNTTTAFAATATDGSGGSSPCSSPIYYEEVTPDETPPAPPLLTGTLPASPGENATPRLLGSAEAGASVSLYLGAGCGGSPIGTGSAAELGSTGISTGIVVDEGAETAFSAKATDAGSNTSACSTPIAYRRTVRATEQRQQPPSPPPSAPASPTPPPSCVVPKLAGKSLKAARAALTKVHCALGIVRRPRPRPGRRERFVVASSRPAAGAVRPAGTRVALRLVAKRGPHKHHR